MKREITAFLISLGVIALIVFCVWKFELMKSYWPSQVYEYVEEYEPNDEFSECVMADIGDDFSYRNSMVFERGMARTGGTKGL